MKKLTKRASSNTRRVLPNPYNPSSPDYAERHTAHSVQVGGIVRVDMGRPVGLVRDGKEGRRIA